MAFFLRFLFYPVITSRIFPLSPHVIMSYYPGFRTLALNHEVITTRLGVCRQSFVLGIHFNYHSFTNFTNFGDFSFHVVKVARSVCVFLDKVMKHKEVMPLPVVYVRACATVSMTSRNFATDPNTRTNTIIFHAKG